MVSYFTYNSFLELRKVFFIILCGIMFLPISLFASEPVDLGEIVVEDKVETLPRPTLDSTAIHTILIPDKSDKDIHTIPQLLEQSVGINIKRYGGMDDFSALSVRGSSTNQVQIYFDDIPITTANGAIINFGIIPLGSIDSVEVYRGGSPGIVPESTIGGVILLKSKGVSEKTKSSTGFTVGSFESVKFKANLQKSWNKFSTVLAYENSRSEGDFTYKDNNGTRFNAQDDKILRRQNNAFSSNSLFTKGLIALPLDLTLSITNIFFQKQEGVPGLGSRLSTDAHLTTWRNITSVGLAKNSLFTSHLDMHFDMFFDYLNSEFWDPQAEISLTPEDTNDKTYRFGPKLSLNYEFNSDYKLIYFVAERSEYYAPENKIGPPEDGGKSNRQSLHNGLQADLMFKERLNIVPSVRFEALYNNGDLPSGNDYQFSAKLGASLRLLDEFYLKSNIYRGFRNPTFSELFGDKGSIEGNPSLVPEKGFNIDAGLSYDYFGKSWFNFGHFEASYFRNDVDRLIQFVQTSTYTIKAMNLNKALIQGAEIVIITKFLKRLKFTSSYTFQLAKDTSNNPDTRGKYLPGRPKHELYSIIAWDEQWTSWFNSNLYCDLRYISGNYLDTQNLLKVNDRVLLGLGTTINFTKIFGLSFSVQNLLNDRISDLVGYPLPGRSYWGTLDIKI